MKRTVFIASILMSFSVYAKIVTGDKCGDNCSWTFDTESKTLTISGTGAIQDYGEAYSGANGIAERPWHSLSSEIENVVVEKGITGIGNRSFEFMGSLKTVRIDGDITTAGFGGLAHNPNLESVVISGASLNYNEITINDTPKLKNFYCSKENEAMCQAILENSQKTEAEISNILKTYSQKGNRYIFDKTAYKSLSDLQEGIPVKRIYTLEEANAVAGDKNRVSIKYR